MSRKKYSRDTRQDLKSEIRNSKYRVSGIPPRRDTKQIQMTEEENPKRYDLEERSFLFARRVRAFVRMLPKTIANIEDVKQLVRASGSVGANYIEAN